MTQVRSGEPTDLSRLREIQSRALAEPWPELLETATRGPPVLRVLVDDDRPLGYAIVIEGGSVATLPELAVHPDEQGQGYGSRLLADVCNRLAERGCSELRLTVEAADDRARRFYRANGFERLDRLPDHFERGDGLLLGRRL